MPRVSRLAVHPIKSLDPESRDRVSVRANGGLVGDREYAVVDADGDYVNGKRTDAVHRLRTDVEFAGDTPAAVTIHTEAEGVPEPLQTGARFRLPEDAGDDGDMPDLLSRYFGYEVHLRRDRRKGLPDDTTDAGPTVVSTATLKRVAEWTGVSLGSVRRRFRANVEVDAPEPFWEDRLYAADGPVRFRIGDLELLGTGPCPRCVVPLRDPDTGEETSEFREQLVAGREAELPAWAPERRFDHFFKLAVTTRRPASAEGEATDVAVGDEVRVESVASTE